TTPSSARASARAVGWGSSLEEARIDPPVRYETDGEDGESAFPHVYGPLTLDPVAEIFPFEQDETGFRLPEALLNTASTND
ncbi:DUF952 domain-containing protein, partial [Halorubrum sp. 48-1-W]|uniref:DUF952 domain-containing protein n=1 Tax=Halorubrum sp. 48-1-W TaxID=2249761 RepID=UPI000FCCBBAD